MPDLSKPKILIVEDTKANIDILVDSLGNDYEVSVAINGEAALKHLENFLPDIILLDIMMPGMDGYEVCKILKTQKKTKEIPIIFLTALADEENEAKGLSLGAVDYIIKPFNYELVKARVRNHVELKFHRDHLETLVVERTRQLEITQEVTIESICALVESRDPETGGHIKRTQNYVKLLGKQLKKNMVFAGYLNDATIDLLYKSAPLHDIGKVGIPDSILLKPGKLTHEEFEQMKEHTVKGRDAIRKSVKKLGSNSFLNIAEDLIYTHQEKWDGTGYPCGIKGEKIPIPGRLMAVADVYDALISKRAYKPPFPHEKAMEIMLDGKGRHFDPDMMDGFFSVKNQIQEIAIKFADQDE